ncbi:MAG: sulfotransferase [Flavobacteriaceae bacterium]|nr:sulfotransferase [Flavobacteriaceae bacterium]
MTILGKNIQPIIMIGAMKCGTSTIFKHLQLHPQICFPPLKEPEYFSKSMGQEKYKLGAYEALFDIQPGHNYTFDGSTGYAKFPAEKGVAQRIYDYGLQPKFLYIVRNPFQRIESHYNFMRKDLQWKSSIIADHLIHTSNYFIQLEQYATYFDKNDFLILDFEELMADYKKTLKRIYDFVGIEDYVFSENEIQNNKTKAVNRNELKLQKQLGGKFGFLPKSFRQFAKKVLGKLSKREKRTLSAKERTYVREKLQSDMLKFQEVYGFDVSRWGFNK